LLFADDVKIFRCNKFHWRLHCPAVWHQLHTRLGFC
jgi:hypothetical protein